MKIGVAMRRLRMSEWAFAPQNDHRIGSPIMVPSLVGYEPGGHRGDYTKASNVRSACRGLLNSVFENIDVIGCPTLTTPPFPITPEAMYEATFLQDLRALLNGW